MTGFASLSQEGVDFQIQATISSVNGKGAQVKVRLPEAYRHLDIPIRKKIASQISRGSINLSVNIHLDNSMPIKIDKSRLTSFLKSIEDATGYKPTEVSIQDISVIPDIFIEDIDVVRADIELAIDQIITNLLNDFNQMRTVEGSSLKINLESQLSEIKKLVKEIRDLSAGAVEINMQKIKDRVHNLLSGYDQEIKREDMLREVAILADKCDITEELDRLDAHIPAFQKALSEGRVGKKLDFILQEMNRETNTTGSKTSQVEVSERVISIKSLIEAMREQSLNIE